MRARVRSGPIAPIGPIACEPTGDFIGLDSARLRGLGLAALAEAP
jgi:hypothetical protein